MRFGNCLQFIYFLTIFIILSNNTVMILGSYGNSFKFSINIAVLCLFSVLWILSVFMIYKKKPKVIFKVSLKGFSQTESYL